VNKPLVKLNNFTINVLGYSLWLGKSSVFSFLTTKLKVSMQDMEDNFNVLGTSGLSLLCERGYIEILKQFLPFYIQNYSGFKVVQDKSSTLSFTNNRYTNDSLEPSLTPIQLACKNGHLHIIHFINDYFSINYPPFILNIHHIDEITGENCALISVRTGNFPMIKLLHESAKADFHLKNNNNEGALQVLAASTKCNYGLQFLECVMYLVEVIRVDISYMHEETLLLLDNKIIVKYIEEKLKQVGILTTKQDLEAMYRIKLYKRPEPREDSDSFVGDTQEISAIAPESFPSNFARSLKL
jgi:ankyrin repeat protein